MRRLSPILLLCAMASVTLMVNGEQVESSNESSEIPMIVITAPLLKTQWQESPSGVTLIEGGDIREQPAILQPTDRLNLAPGVLVQNRNNFAQNPRVSIRGFGSRAPFGIRGVRVQLDGIPLTTVDGQAQIDAIDPSSIRTIEVLRGANAVLHGNGSGGLIDFNSLTPGRSLPANLGLQMGGEGFRRLHGGFSTRRSRFGLRGTVSQLEQDGYREQSRVERRNVSLRLDHEGADHQTFALFNHLDNPLAEDPGALTEAEWKSNRSQSARLAGLMNAGQKVTQNIVSVGTQRDLAGPDHSFSIQAWGLTRDFQQQLPFPGDSLIGFDRRILGARLEYQRPLDDVVLHSQVSLTSQTDDRRRYCRDIRLNPTLCRVGLTTDLALDQRESAGNLGLGLQLAGPVMDARGRWVFGLRHDRLRMEIDDRLQPGGLDNSGRRDFSQTHYSLGYSHELNDGWSAFGQLATSFEAPTFTEFANPTGSGFRPGLRPQSSQSFEIGLRSALKGFQLEASYFQVRVDDEIIVDANSGAPLTDDRTFYRNADRTRRDGFELGGRWRPVTLADLQFSGALTVMDACYDDATGNRLPGLPKWSAFVDARYALPDGYFAGFSTQYIGSRYADDANTAKVAAQNVSAVRFGRVVPVGPKDLEFTIGIENLFDTDYLDNLRINARNGRYFEPGSERRLVASLNVSFF